MLSPNRELDLLIGFEIGSSIGEVPNNDIVNDLPDGDGGFNNIIRRQTKSLGKQQAEGGNGFRR